MKTIKLGGWTNQNYVKINKSKIALLYDKLIAKFSFRPYRDVNEIYEENTNSVIPLMELNEEFSSS